jgi:SAM-dependent methyltransferase
VIAVEPNAEMRSLCKELHAADAAFHVIAGSAEETTLPDASVDMITVGRALHWFNMDQALPEFRRILKPSGWVVIVASGREGSGRAENEAFEMLLRTGANTQESTRASYVVYDRLDKFFAKGTLHHTEIPGEMHVDWNELRGLTLSTSHAPLPESENFAAFERALEEFFQRFQNEGKLTLATRTWMNAGRFE